MGVKLIHKSGSMNVGSFYTVDGVETLEEAIKLFEKELNMTAFKKGCLRIDNEVVKLMGSKLEIGSFWIESTPAALV